MTIHGLRLPVFFLFFLGFPLLWLSWIGVYTLQPGPPSPGSAIDVVIPSHTGISAIENILIGKRVIRDDRRFTLLVMLTGSAKKLRAGEYRFTAGRKPLEIISVLRKGQVLYRPVTIPEGTAMKKIADILAADGWVDRTRFAELVYDRRFIDQLGIAADSLEGYLFPDTYYFSRGQQDEKAILRMMADNHFRIYNRLLGEAKHREQVLSHHEIITLAAIVEKETGLVEERPMVAAVFLNRLQKGMRLQADPTIFYRQPENGYGLETTSLYNTYVIQGLPPGPITNPGEAAIRAVLNPAQVDYLYFVAKDDNSHQFSRTLEEHNRAVAKYRREKESRDRGTH